MPNKLPKTLFPFIWHFLKEYKTAVTVFVGLALAAGFWGPFNSMLVKNLINLLPETPKHNIEPLILPASLIALNFIVFDNFTWRGIAYIRYRFVPLILNQVDKALLNYTLGHSHQFFQERMSGSLAKQIFHLVDGIEKILTSCAANMLRGTSLLIIAFIAAYSVNPIFALILIVWFCVFLSVSLFMLKRLSLLSEVQAEKESVLGGQIIDSLSNQSNVHLFARREHEIVRRNPFLKEYVNAYRNKDRYALIMHALQGGLIALMMMFSSYFLVYLYGKNLVTVGDFALILGLSMETGYLMWFTMYEMDELNKSMGRCRQSLASLMLPQGIQDHPQARALICAHGQITFENVTFQYKGNGPLFQTLSVEIKAGEKVGLVGYSGGGKSTFVNLILRLYEIKSGSIRIDGQDIKDVTQDSLHQSIGMIPQDPVLFHRTLIENIHYGRLDASDLEVIEASKKAHSHEFIEKLPQKYDSLVGERGVKLSGGQRQRIAIARAILKNAPILILDEATSQLDSLTESEIQESLWDLMQGKTTIVIAHRLSTLQHMDRILVFDQGKIVQDGAHEQLLTQDGLYKNLWERQVGGFLGL